jgi:hypothetical protein
MEWILGDLQRQQTLFVSAMHENVEEGLCRCAMAWKFGIGMVVGINLCPGFHARLAVCQTIIGESLNGQWLEVLREYSNHQ